MKVFTTTLSAGPNGRVDADKVIDVPDAFAAYLVEQGLARKAPVDAKVNAQWPHGTDVPKAPKAEPTKPTS